MAAVTRSGSLRQVINDPPSGVVFRSGAGSCCPAPDRSSGRAARGSIPISACSERGRRCDGSTSPMSNRPNPASIASCSSPASEWRRWAARRAHPRVAVERVENGSSVREVERAGEETRHGCRLASPPGSRRRNSNAGRMSRQAVEKKEKKHGRDDMESGSGCWTEEVLAKHAGRPQSLRPGQRRPPFRPS